MFLIFLFPRDLATRNVLVKCRNLVQITDFGLAKMLHGDEDNGEVIVQFGRVPIRWLAIETLRSGRYSFKTDVWAYGELSDDDTCLSNQIC